MFNVLPGIQKLACRQSSAIDTMDYSNPAVKSGGPCTFVPPRQKMGVRTPEPAQDRRHWLRYCLPYCCMPITKGTERGGRQPKHRKLKFPGYDRAWLDRLMFKWSLFFWNLAKRRQ